MCTRTTTCGDQTEKRRVRVCAVYSISHFFFFRYYYIIIIYCYCIITRDLPSLICVFRSARALTTNYYYYSHNVKKKKTAIITQRAPVLNGISIITVGRTRSVFVNDRGVMVFWLSLPTGPAARVYIIIIGTCALQQQQTRKTLYTSETNSHTTNNTTGGKTI